MTEQLSAILSAVRALVGPGGRVDVQVMPAGHMSTSIQVDTTADVYSLAVDLDLPTPELSSNGRNEWWHTERGEWGFERISIVGGHRPVCQCHGSKEAA